MARYELTPAAEFDLLNIAYFGMSQFGVEQSERYRDMLATRFQQIAEAPMQYPAVDYVRRGYRRSVCGSHSIYYRVRTECVEIMRVIRSEDF